MPDETMEPEFAWRCDVCQSRAPPWKKHNMTVAPAVLCVQLNRWRHAGRAGAILDHVHPDQEVLFNSVRYRFQSVVVHLGASPSSGHYVTCARHETSTGAWWLYNDAIRREATPGEVACTALWGRQPMKAYILFYERL